MARKTVTTAHDLTTLPGFLAAYDERVQARRTEHHWCSAYISYAYPGDALPRPSYRTDAPELTTAISPDDLSEAGRERLLPLLTAKLDAAKAAALKAIKTAVTDGSLPFAEAAEDAAALGLTLPEWAEVQSGYVSGSIYCTFPAEPDREALRDECRAAVEAVIVAKGGTITDGGYMDSGFSRTHRWV